MDKKLFLDTDFSFVFRAISSKKQRFCEAKLNANFKVAKSFVLYPAKNSTGYQLIFLRHRHETTKDPHFTPINFVGKRANKIKPDFSLIEKRAIKETCHQLKSKADLSKKNILQIINQSREIINRKQLLVFVANLRFTPVFSSKVSLYGSSHFRTISPWGLQISDWHRWIQIKNLYPVMDDFLVEPCTSLGVIPLMKGFTGGINSVFSGERKGLLSRTNLRFVSKASTNLRFVSRFVLVKVTPPVKPQAARTNLRFVKVTPPVKTEASRTNLRFVKVTPPVKPETSRTNLRFVKVTPPVKPEALPPVKPKASPPVKQSKYKYKSTICKKICKKSGTCKGITYKSTICKGEVMPLLKPKVTPFTYHITYKSTICKGEVIPLASSLVIETQKKNLKKKKSNWHAKQSEALYEKKTKPNPLPIVDLLGLKFVNQNPKKPNSGTQSQKDSNKIILSISGGQDSIFLLFCLSFLQSQIAFKPKIIWCNHFWQKASFYTSLHLTKSALAFSSPIIEFLPFHMGTYSQLYQRVTTGFCSGHFRTKKSQSTISIYFTKKQGKHELSIKNGFYATRTEWNKKKPKAYTKFVTEISETRARNWRHITIERACTFYGSTLCLYGHTLSDRVETILFNLMRGTKNKTFQTLPWKRRHSTFCYNRFYPTFEQVIKSTHIHFM